VRENKGKQNIFYKYNKLCKKIVLKLEINICIFKMFVFNGIFEASLSLSIVTHEGASKNVVFPR